MGNFSKSKIYCLCTRCIIVNSVQVRSEFGKFAYTAICMRKCTLWSDNTCVFTRFHSVKNANTQLIWSSVKSNINYISVKDNLLITMETASCVKQVIMAANQYKNSKTDGNMVYLQRQLEVIKMKIVILVEKIFMLVLTWRVKQSLCY